MATKRTAEQLKALKVPELRSAAREWNVSVAGKKPADIIREIVSKQNGGKTAASGSNTKVPGAAKATTGSLTGKPKAPVPGAKAAPPKAPAGRPPVPGAAKPAAPAPKAAAPKAPPAKPVIPSKAPPAPVQKKAAPPAPPAGAKAPSVDTEAKFKALIQAEFKTLNSASTSRISALEKSLGETRAKLDELYGAAMQQADETEAAGEEVVEEEAAGEEVAEGEQEVEITQEQLEAMDLDQLKDVAGQLGVEVKKTDKAPTLLARILTALGGSVSEEAEPDEAREATGDYSWQAEGVTCFVLMDNEWKEGAISKINAKSGKITAFVYNPEDESQGWELEVGPDELAPYPTDDGEAGAEAAAADEEVGEEAVEEEVMEEEAVEEEVAEA